MAPPVNHWWHVTLFTSARGLTTLSMPCNGRTVEMTFDFVDHQLVVAVSDGQQRTVALEPKTVATFYKEVMEALAELQIRRPSLDRSSRDAGVHDAVRTGHRASVRTTGTLSASGGRRCCR